MAAPFTRQKNDLEKRYNSLALKLNQELGFRRPALRFKTFDDRTGVTVWKLENTEPELRRGLAEGMTATLAQAADDGAELQFYLSEHWVRERTTYRFKSCNLRFVILSTDPGATPLSFRLEWAGREASDQAGWEFTGKGAAHPHWQFDGELRPVILQNPALPIADDDTNLVVDVPLGSEASVLAVELGAEAALPVLPLPTTAPVGALPWFHKLHLPAKATWSDMACVMPDSAAPQQHQPSSTGELDNWVLSALRYMTHEFQLYSA